MRKTLLFLAILTVTACEFSVKTDNKKEADKKDNGKIRNGITLKEEGLKVNQAFLLDQDGNLVSDKNLTKVNQALRLRLIIDSNSLKVNDDGKVSMGGSEKIVNSEGQILLDEKDLFKEGGELSRLDATVITFYVTINRITSLVDYYEANCRVWDKSTNKAVSASFRFNIA